MPLYRIIIDVEAINDLREIADWYEKIDQNLKNRFLISAKKEIDSLKNNPLKFSIKYDHVRCKLIKKFPFLIHFTCDEHQKLVTVFAIFHTSRNPEIWKNRN